MQNVKCKVQNQVPYLDISERLLRYAANAIKLAVRICGTEPGRHIARQLTSAATSAGANYEEGCAAESRADFVHKLQVALKELRESVYWLKLIRYAQLIRPDDPLLVSQLREGLELCKIIASSVVTAKKNMAVNHHRR